MFFDAIWIQRFTGAPRAIVGGNCVRPLSMQGSLPIFWSRPDAISFPQLRNREASPRHDRRAGRSAARTRSTSCRSRYRSTKVGGTGYPGEPHARDIALRRRAEQAVVLAAEMRRALIPHSHGGAARAHVL